MGAQKGKDLLVKMFDGASYVTVAGLRSRKIDNAEHARIVASLPLRYRALAKHITALLRLAVLFRRARRAESLPQMQLAASARSLRLKLPPGWGEQHPLTEADLQQEKAPMTELGVKLDLANK